MAIEFNCPYCTAAIRVPDAFSGKKGSCPKCATKLVVPHIVPPAAEATSSQLNSSEVLAMPPDSTQMPGTPTATESQLTTPVGPAKQLIGMPGSVRPDTDVPYFAPPKNTATSMSRRLKKKSRRSKSQQLYSIGVPVVCFLLFFGVIAIVISLQKPELKGTLLGTRAVAMQIPVKSIALADLNLTLEQRSEIESAFTEDVESFVSSQMTCRLGGDGGDITVTVSIGDRFSWFAVNPSSNLTLSDWIRQNQSTLNTDRMNRIVKAGNSLCVDKLKKVGGDSVVFDAGLYRDDFALNAHVKAFGYAVEAIAGQRKSVCAHEDSRGTLYFALPDDTKSFVLRGRSYGGTTLFPGEYQVDVIGEDSIPAPAEDVPAKESPSPAMQDDMQSNPMEPATDDPADSSPGMAVPMMNAT